MSLGKQEEGVPKVRVLQLLLLGCPQNLCIFSQITIVQ